MPTWNLNGYVTLLERAGYHVDVLLNEKVSVSFLTTSLSKYDAIILRTDYFHYEGFNYYCTGEPVNSKTRTTFAAQISVQELQVNGFCLGFSLIFLQHNYPAGSLKPGLVFVVASDSTVLASPFLTGGSSAFLGYETTFGLGWGRLDAISIKLLKYLSEKSSVRDSIAKLFSYLTAGHGITSKLPPIYYAGNGNFKL